MYYTHCAERSAKTFLYYTYDHCGGECFESLLFFRLLKKKSYVLKYEKWINRLKRNDFFFLKKKIIWVDKSKFKNISITLFQSLLMYEQNTCKKTWKKAVKRKQNFQNFAK